MSNAEERGSKVLYATFEHIPSPSGTACWSSEVIRELARHFDLDGLSLKSEDLSHIERYFGARLLRVPISDGPYLDRVKSFQRALNRQLDSEEYALCHHTSIWEGMVLAARRKALDFKLVYELHSLPSLDFRVSHPDRAREVETSYSLKQQEERCFDMADRILACSPLIREHLIRRGVPAKKIALVTPALDLTPFDRVPDKPGQVGTILYLGSLKPWQGVISLLHAVSALPRHIRVRLVLIVSRSEPGFAEVQGKIQMMGLSRNVEFVDPMPLQELPALVSQASVCVAPLANHEHNRTAASLPHKVLVYMACRRPVVAAQQPVLRGLLEHETTGLLYPPGDTHGLVQALKRLLLDRELAARLGNQARLHLEEHYSLQGSLQALHAAYQQLIGEPAGVPSTLPAQDTQPSLVSADPAARFGKEPETRPVPARSLPAPRQKLGPDTAPVMVSPCLADTDPGLTPEPDTDPSRTARTDDEIMFRSVEDEDTAPRPEPTDPNDWQVMEAVDVQMTDHEQESRQNQTDQAAPSSETSKRRRYLLGGPSYPVEEEYRPAQLPISKDSTQPSATPLFPSDEPPMTKNDEIQPVEPAEKPKPPSPAGRKE